MSKFIPLRNLKQKLYRRKKINYSNGNFRLGSISYDNYSKSIKKK